MESFAIEKKFTPQYPVSLVEQITEFLTNSIIKGDIKGGQRLVENELQRKFRISRAPIRESFRILEKNGLVVNIPRKGTFIRKITEKDVKELFPIRAYLEGLAARMAISFLERGDIEKMGLFLSEMAKAIKNNAFDNYHRHHTKYHNTFINASKNNTLIEILENLRRQAVWFRFSYFYVQESFETAINVHQEILDFFIKRDAERVETLVKNHIMASLDKFLESLSSSHLKEKLISRS